MTDAGVNPIFNQELLLDYQNEQEIEFRVWDGETIGSDKFVGEARVSLKAVINGGGSWAGDLQLFHNGKKPAGVLNVHIYLIAAAGSPELSHLAPISRGIPAAPSAPQYPASPQNVSPYPSAPPPSAPAPVPQYPAMNTQPAYGQYEAQPMQQATGYVQQPQPMYAQQGQYPSLGQPMMAQPIMQPMMQPMMQPVMAQPVMGQPMTVVGQPVVMQQQMTYGQPQVVYRPPPGAVIYRPPF